MTAKPEPGPGGGGPNRTRPERLVVALTATEKQRVTAAAEREGTSASEILRRYGVPNPFATRKPPPAA